MSFFCKFLNILLELGWNKCSWVIFSIAEHLFGKFFEFLLNEVQIIQTTAILNLINPQCFSLILMEQLLCYLFVF